MEIQKFHYSIERAPRSRREFRPREVTVVASKSNLLSDGARDVAEVLKRQGYVVNLLQSAFQERGLGDIRLLESLWQSEFCVFLLGDRMSDAHIALAMAHAHSIPSIRLQYDKRSLDCTPSLAGVMRWEKLEDMIVEFERQVTSYREGFVRPVDLARETSATNAAESMGRMRWTPRNENYWDVRDGAALVKHIGTDHGFVHDLVNRARREFGSAFGQARTREDSMAICRHLYEGVRRHNFGYEVEADVKGAAQAIRSPRQIETHKTANCLDLACLFAAMLKVAAQQPTILVLDRPGMSHSLVGYRALDEPGWAEPTLGQLRQALEVGDLVLFEPTGVLETDVPIGAETLEERGRDKVMSFIDARAAAARMLTADDVRVRHFVDVRKREQANEP